MATLRVDDFEVFYEERGTGTPLVFLHGLGSSTRDWKFQLEHFSKHYRCVAPAHVVGLSMGGMTSLQLALDAPALPGS